MLEHLPLLLEPGNTAHFFKIYFILFFCFLGLHPRHLEVPRLEVESELQLLAYATTRAMWDPCCICDLHHSLQQHQILNLLSEARYQTHILMDTNWICFHQPMTGTPYFFIYFYFIFLVLMYSLIKRLLVGHLVGLCQLVLIRTLLSLFIVKLLFMCKVVNPKLSLGTLMK